MQRQKNKLRMLAHFVWATENRQLWITENIETEVYRYIQKVCRDEKCEVLAIGGMPDHIHLFVALSNTITISDLMRNVKGGSSRLISKTLKPEGWFKWQAHYGAFSVSPRDKDRVAAYIHNQKKRHNSGKLWAEAEETFEEYDDEEPMITSK